MGQQGWLEQMRDELANSRRELSERESSLTDLRTHISRLENAIAAMEGVSDSRGADGRARRSISPEARQRIVAAQRRRWERVRELKANENSEKQERLRQADAKRG